MSRSKIAVFIDVENLTHWLKEKGPEKLVTELSSTGQLIVRKAYGNWNTPNIQGFQADLNRQGFELMHNYHPVAGKNSSDIQLTVDVMESALRLADVEWFVLATGDSDFSPLFRRLREMGKEVIGVGPRSPLSESVKTSCTRYIFTDAPESLDEDTRSEELKKAIKLTISTLKTFDGAADCSVLKNRLISIDSAFNEKAFGFTSFTDFLKSIDAIEVNQHEKRKCWQANLTPASPQVEKPKLPTAEPDTDTITLKKNYLQFLKKQKWPLVERHLLTKALTIAITLPPLPKNDFPTELVISSKGQIDEAEAKLVSSILFKSQLFEVSTSKQKTGESISCYQLKSGQNYLHKIDQAMVSRLNTACLKHGQPLNYAIVQSITFNKYPQNLFTEMLQ
ncbi:NYN domain-containing protein [Endozoicomonas atrinae]|uniref:NYN domain-containing protein n=1 Tax=Endozoicomonas atrinae TaxID=1333660 RepID=UPI003AFF916D